MASLETGGGLVPEQCADALDRLEVLAMTERPHAAPVGECLVVAKCEPGLASSVAVEIDRAAIPEIVGTLAGEDTIFIAVP